jgi:transposase
VKRSDGTIARLMTPGRDTLSKSETVTIAAIEDGVRLLVEARKVVAAFHAMIRKKDHADLDPWLERARASLVASFANGVTKDQAAVSAAITSPWSNGQTEGQITKLKLVKRQTYGRAKLDPLQARLIGATGPKLRQDCVRAHFAFRNSKGRGHPITSGLRTLIQAEVNPGSTEPGV